MILQAPLVELPTEQLPDPWFPSDMPRVRHTRLRRRMLVGTWREDLRETVQKEVGGLRREAWGEPDTHSNVFRSACQSLATLYDVQGTIEADDQVSADVVSAALEKAGFWQMMQRLERDCIGMREMLMVPEVVTDGEGRRLLLRTVNPDCVSAIADPAEPDEPIVLVETCERDGAWGYDYWDVRDPNAPFFMRYDRNKKFVEGSTIAGEAYTWRVGGRPFIPHVLYHAARSGQLWDAFEGVELVEGTLRLGVHYTFYGHCLRNASWPQRVIVNGRLAGASTTGEGETQVRPQVTTDPSTVLMVEGYEDAASNGGVMVTQWEISSDPAAMLESIQAYERSLYAMAGLSPADAQRVAGDPRSGFALAINKENQVADQRRYAPVFRRGDAELCERVGALFGLAPVDYRVRYGFELAAEAVIQAPTAPPSPEQQAQQSQENA
jgi:hypothetical protein